MSTVASRSSTRTVAIFGITTLAAAAVTAQIVVRDPHVSTPCLAVAFFLAFVFGRRSLVDDVGRVTWTPAEPLVFAAAIFSGPWLASALGAAEGLALGVSRPAGGVSRMSLRAAQHAARAAAASIAFELCAPFAFRQAEGLSTRLILATAVLSGVASVLSFVRTLRPQRTTPRARREHAIWRPAAALLPLHVGSAAFALGAWTVYNDVGLIALAPALALAAALHLGHRQHCLRLRRERDRSNGAARLFGRVVDAVGLVLDARDDETRTSPRGAQRVNGYASTLARTIVEDPEAMDLDPTDLAPEWVETVQVASALRNVGMLAVSSDGRAEPDGEPVDPEKLHGLTGERLVERLGLPGDVGPAIRYHHERWDGRGFPDGLEGESIPLAARVLHLAEAIDEQVESGEFDDNAVARVRAFVAQNAGKRFDPRLSALFCQRAEEILSAGLEAERRHLVPRPHGAQEFSHALRRSRRLRTVLDELTRDLGSTLELHALVRLGLGRLLELGQAHSCALYLMHQDSGTLEAIDALGKASQTLRDQSFAPGEGLTGWVYKTRRAVENADRRVDLGEASSSESREERLFAYPLVHGDECLGVVVLLGADAETRGEEASSMLQRGVASIARALRHALLYEQTREHSMTDALTRLPNARALRSHFSKELARARRTNTPLSVVVMDLDRFKPINDTFGHQTGDRVLNEVANILRRTFRACDHVCRWAGDEFAALLPEADVTSAQAIVERVQSAIENAEIELAPGVTATIGISAGVAVYPEQGGDLEELLSHADQAMYVDKAERHARSAEAQQTLPSPSS